MPPLPVAGDGAGRAGAAAGGATGRGAAAGGMTGRGAAGAGAAGLGAAGFAATGFRVATLRAGFRAAFFAVLRAAVFRAGAFLAAARFAVFLAPVFLFAAVLRALVFRAPALFFLLAVRFFPLFLVAMACAPILLQCRTRPLKWMHTRSNHASSWFQACSPTGRVNRYFHYTMIAGKKRTNYPKRASRRQKNLEKIRMAPLRRLIRLGRSRERSFPCPYGGESQGRRSEP
jgi:hypothetical protein